MNKNENQKFLAVSSFFVGFLFALGLALGGMLNPNRIIAFLDFTGAWDPSLCFVMIGAISVHMISYRFIKNKSNPIWDIEFHLPKQKNINPQLILGSILFGIGWGLIGFCPGPAVVSLISGTVEVWIFILSMLTGVGLYTVLKKSSLDFFR